MNVKVLWLITARSGSKSIPDKNIKPLGGVPLMGYRILSALRVAGKEDVWVSTDSSLYAAVGKQMGATIPFLRPSELASDAARSEDTVMHAMRHAASIGRRYDAIGLLEPTSPFITSGQLEGAVNRLFLDSAAESIVAVRRVRPSTFYVQPHTKYLSAISQNIRSHGLLRRQDEGEEITPSGGFYISKWDSFLKTKTFYSERALAFLVPDLNGLEIDEPIDWCWAEFLIDRRVLNPSDFLGDRHHENISQ